MSIRILMLGFFLTATSASAATFNFSDFPFDRSMPNPVVYTDGSVSITVTAGGGGTPQVAERTSPGSIFPPGYWRGIGVISNDSVGPFNGSIEAQEFLSIEIPDGYEVTSVTLTKNDGTNDPYSILASFGALSTSLTVTSPNTVSNDGRETFLLNTGDIGSIFQLTHLSGSNGLFLNELAITEVVSAIPLPASGLLLVGAFFVGGTMARRKRKNS